MSRRRLAGVRYRVLWHYEFGGVLRAISWESSLPSAVMRYRVLRHYECGGVLRAISWEVFVAVCGHGHKSTPLTAP